MKREILIVAVVSALLGVGWWALNQNYEMEFNVAKWVAPVLILILAFSNLNYAREVKRLKAQLERATAPTGRDVK